MNRSLPLYLSIISCFVTVVSDAAPPNVIVVFELDLPLGPTELVTRLFDEKGEFGGAHFTGVEAL